MKQILICYCYVCVCAACTRVCVCSGITQLDGGVQGHLKRIIESCMMQIAAVRDNTSSAEPVQSPSVRAAEQKVSTEDIEEMVR